MGLAGLVGEDALHVVFQQLNDDPSPATLLSNSWEVAVDESAVIVDGHDSVDGLGESVDLPPEGENPGPVPGV